MKRIEILVAAFLLIALNLQAGSQIIERGADQTPESASVLLAKRIRSGCGTIIRRDPKDLVVPVNSKFQFVSVLNGKEMSNEEWAANARRIRVTTCTMDNIQVTFLGTFPSTAVVTYHIQHDESRGRKVKMFSAYAKHTFEYMESEWMLRRMEAVSAK